METCPGEGVMKEEKVSKQQETLSGGSVGSFGISEGNITRRGTKKTPQNMRLTTTPSIELA